MTAPGMPAARILVVDDTPSNVKVLRTLLTVHGYQVDVAHNGAEALQQAAASRPDMVLLDVVMPVMDGFEACRRLRDMPDMASAPIVMVTASGPQERERALAAGANDMIMKPIDPDLVLSLVRSLLGPGGAAG